MISFQKFKSALRDILDDLAEAAFAAMAWLEEGEAFAPLINATRQVVPARVRSSSR